MSIKNKEIEEIRLALTRFLGIYANKWPKSGNPDYVKCQNELKKALKYIEELESRHTEIKKLDWNIFLNGGLWEAKALGGIYQVQESCMKGKEGNYSVCFYFNVSAIRISNKLGIDKIQGMKLAQEHFEKMVRECLV